MGDFSVEFVPAKPSDAMLLSSLRKQIRQETYRGIYKDESLDVFDFAQNIQTFTAQIESGVQQLNLICADDEAVGYIGAGKPIYWYPDSADKSALFLNALYVKKSYWRMGIGRAAMKFVMGLGRELGKTKLYNNCNMHNVNAIAFYRACGGKEIFSEGGHADCAEDQMTFEYDLL